MKAYMVEDLKSETGGCTVVFAETRGKAHKLAQSTNCCEDADWIDIRTIRLPAMDKMYKPGKIEMDWSDPEDRIALVKDGWSCNHEYLDRGRDCPVCPAAEWCWDYQDWLEDKEDE